MSTARMEATGMLNESLFMRVAVGVLTALILAVGAWAVTSHEAIIRCQYQQPALLERINSLEETRDQYKEFTAKDGDKLEARITVLERGLGDIKADIREVRVLLTSIAGVRAPDRSAFAKAAP
jgi:hypothetical protein